VPDDLWPAVLERIETVKAETLALSAARGEVGTDRAGVVAGTVGRGTPVRVGVVRVSRP